MPDVKNTKNAQKALNDALGLAISYNHEFITPEHVLRAITNQEPFQLAAADLSVETAKLQALLDIDLLNQEVMPKQDMPTVSVQTQEMLETAFNQVAFSSAEMIDVPHLIKGILTLKESRAAYELRRAFDTEDAEIVRQMVDEYEMASIWDLDDEKETDDNDDEEGAGHHKVEPWRSLVSCANDMVDESHPLIGREEELERTIQVLCRRDKNNVLHIGEAGVGKTALIFGLADKVNRDQVPDRLKGARIYLFDIGTLLAGTQFRGDFEKRIKTVMDGVSKEKNPIVYIDEIHNLVGAGSTGEGSMDASNMLKPYLERGKIRFIGSTTYAEYNRYFARHAGIVRRFQQIVIDEPTIDEAISILEGLKAGYEEFHHVTYEPETIPYAVEASAKYINDRFLPDKAIDLIDEAGAYREIHPLDRKEQKVDKALVETILAKVCKVDAKALKEEHADALEHLYEHLSAQIYGQDEAVRQVVEAIQMSKAGLLDDNKPLASLLFVGPTGVGKTEVARVLAQELGVELVRFDMSEYTEKHTVAKLIGSPAGYVGYEDGGLLTDAIRKTPNCVLLMDEIEKAHSDIYNILLQVMDYARLTDNKGQKAVFRNVVLIMTSNAGAQYASQASVGFGPRVSRGEAMLKQVKKTFKPEFLNRLTETVVFHDMDRQMASLILDKKLRELAKKLETRHVTLTLKPETREQLLEEGFTTEYGAREMDRVIARRLKPILMREILFGSLKNGGNITL